MAVCFATPEACNVVGSEAFGAPGITPGWTLSDKSAVGTVVDHVGSTKLTTVPRKSIHFTLIWIGAIRWEGLNHAVTER
jgi:hypothetical protein